MPGKQKGEDQSPPPSREHHTGSRPGGQFSLARKVSIPREQRERDRGGVRTRVYTLARESPDHSATRSADDPIGADSASSNRASGWGGRSEWGRHRGQELRSRSAGATLSAILIGGGQVSEQMPEERRRRKGRSPSYPGIALGDAIQKARVLYEKEGRHPAYMDVITDHWGYRPKTGPGLVSIAALKKFGLLEEVEGNGSRGARLTELALSILLHEERSPERQRWVQEAALMPSIHAELWVQFNGHLPSDKNLRRVLVLDRHFTESGAHQFIRQFKSTIAFAGLDEPDTMHDAQPSQHRPSGEHMAPQAIRPAGIPSEEAFGKPRVSTDAGSVKVTFPLAVDMDTSLWPVLQVPIPMTEEAWEQMLGAINVLKVGVVRRTTSADNSTPAPAPTATSEVAGE